MMSAALGLNVSAQAISFTLTDLGANVVPRDINNSGDVVGNFRTVANKVHAFRWHTGTLTDLGTTGGDYSDAFCINDAGVIGGESQSSLTDFTYHPFILPVGGSMTDLTPSAPDMMGGWSALTSLNDAGVGTGMMFYTGSGGYKYQVPFLYQSGTLTNIAVNGYNTSERPTSINNWNQLVGGDQGWGQYLYSGGTRYDLPRLGTGGMGNALAINDVGQVVGQSYTMSSPPFHAFLWQPGKHNQTSGKIYDLGTMGGANSSAATINSWGEIIGWSQTTVGTGAQRAFITYAADVIRGSFTLTDLSLIVDPTLTKVFGQPAKVNDAGQIIGQYYDTAGSVYHGCILTPVP